MLDHLFEGIFDGSSSAMDPGAFLACLFAALLIGLFLAAIYCRNSKYTQSFVITLVLLPAAVSMVIMMVNGNIGAGVAVAGAFGLIRFRSAAGSAKEIGMIFIATGAGLAAGMGYIGYAVLFALVLGAAVLLLTQTGFGTDKKRNAERILSITIPENLDYEGIFDDVFQNYTEKAELVKVKTTNMGALFRLTYEIEMKDASKAKQMIDELRCRNGNLEIMISRPESRESEL